MSVPQAPGLAIDPRGGSDATDRLERAVIEALDLPIEHLDDADESRWDGRTTGYLCSADRLWLRAERLAIRPETPIEIKVCQRWIEDRSNANGRRGRWLFEHDAHEALVEHHGVYLLGVRDGDRLPGAAILPALQLPDLTWSRRSGNGARERVAQLRWADVLDPDWLSGGDGRE